MSWFHVANHMLSGGPERAHTPTVSKSVVINQEHMLSGGPERAHTPTVSKSVVRSHVAIIWIGEKSRTHIPADPSRAAPREHVDLSQVVLATVSSSTARHVDYQAIRGVTVVSAR
jgi:hypothetical protein